MQRIDLQTITLELLRPGPSHNQLLSPLTQYVALCDNRGAVTLNLPFEHRELLRQREALSYHVKNDQREAQLMHTASEIGGKVLGAIPTLGAAMSHPSYGSDTLIHLRLILSAAELSLLPFEAAHAPKGFPGESKPLLLQSIAPVTITREVRSATLDVRDFARQPRILVIAASPPGFEAVPLRAHMLALRHAIAAWIPAEDASRVHKRITVLPDASVQSIREACAKDDYTHIHILAHGAEYQEGGEKQYGLALFDSTGKKVDVVAGSRLIHALRTRRQDGSGFSCPNYVTLCTCDSGKTGSVVFPGASLAHELHESGVPWVIASQFPLTMAGSVLLTEQLYAGLLRGEDPRVVLHHVRQCLRAEFVNTHDWASLVAYAAVPADFHKLVSEFRHSQMLRAIGASFARADDLIVELFSHANIDLPGIQSQREQIHAQIEAELNRIEESLRLLRHSPNYYEHQGDVARRRAYVLYLASLNQDESGLQVDRWQQAIRRARSSYLHAAKLALNKHRPLTHYLAMSAILGDPIPFDYWTVARVAAETDLDSESRAKALETLIELRLLEVLFNDTADGRLAQDYARQLVHLAQTWEISPILKSSEHRSQSLPGLWRKLERYTDWGKLRGHDRFMRAHTAVVNLLKQAYQGAEEDAQLDS